MSTEERYTERMAQLLPPGLAWARWPGSVLRTLLSALAVEYTRLHGRGLTLLRETDPRVAAELLPDWEQFLGLPSDCAPADQTQAERQEAATVRYTELGGQSRQYFIDLAESLGFTVTITEHHPFVAGSPAGDDLTNGDWPFTWDVNAPEITVSFFRAGRNTAGEPLQFWDREEQLECEIRKRRPAHTIVRFLYNLDPGITAYGYDYGNNYGEAT